MRRAARNERNDSGSSGQELDLHDISSDSFRKILSDQKKSYLCV